MVLLNPIGRELGLEPFCFGECSCSSVGVAGFASGRRERSPRRCETRSKLYRAPVQDDAFLVPSGHEVEKRTRGLIERLVRIARTEPHCLGKMLKSLVPGADKSMSRSEHHISQGEIGV